jgi:integrase/recombinase XerD
MEKITRKAKISLYLDTRRTMLDGTHPIKIQVYYGSQKLFNTGVSATKDDFAGSYKSEKPKGNNLKDLKIELSAIEARANEVAEGIAPFTFEKFEKQLFESKQSLTNVVDHYSSYIAVLDENEQTGNASSYRCSIASIKSFVNDGRRNPTENIPFSIVTPDFLNRYEQWMIRQDNSRTTVGIYLRALRAIFNLAIGNGVVDAELYPFKKYTIPTGKNTKKALENNDLKTLFTADLSEKPLQEKARAFWFFSYQCNGMNIRDISELRFKNMHGTYFSFLRHKTIRTTKEDPKPIIVPITPFVSDVIEKYGNKGGKPNDYVFPVFTHDMTAQQRHLANQYFVRFINQHMKKAATALKLNLKLGTMYARHTFTTKVTRSLGLEFAQEALGHTTLVATQNYWAGFESETKKEMAESLMHFDDPKPIKNGTGRKRLVDKTDQSGAKRKAVRRRQVA